MLVIHLFSIDVVIDDCSGPDRSAERQLVWSGDWHNPRCYPKAHGKVSSMERSVDVFRELSLIRLHILYNHILHRQAVKDLSK